MEQGDNNGGNSIYSKRLRAGRRRTYFFDVRTTKSNDYYLTITESKRRFDEDGYERHKLFLYKEDFNKFIEAMEETVNYIKADLLPEYDFDEFSHKEDEHNSDAEPQNLGAEVASEDIEPIGEEPVAEAVGQEEEVNEEDLKWD